ncbi:MAG: hypothetical protein ACRD4V_02880 [Candidatus Acidiferrales bacterium]
MEKSNEKQEQVKVPAETIPETVTHEEMRRQNALRWPDTGAAQNAEETHNEMPR